jgi:transposase
MTLDKFLHLEEIFIQGYRHLENIGIIFRYRIQKQKSDLSSLWVDE